MNKKVKGLIFISNVHKAMEHEWFIEFTDKNVFDFEFVLFNSDKSDLYNFIKSNDLKCKNYELKTKFLIPLYVLYFFMKMLFGRYDFVHCHLFEASLIGLFSARMAGVKKIIYTRHHSDFHHVYFPKAVKYDLLINKCSTHIIAVSNNVKFILVDKEKVDEKKIIVIPHGIPSEIINDIIPEKYVTLMKQKYELANNYPIIGVISRFTMGKGIQYIIPAFKKLLSVYPNAKLVLCNAQGDYEFELKTLLLELPHNSYTLVVFEKNISHLFKCFDIFIHTPINKFYEAFGQVYIEAMSLDVPMVCTLSGVANDFIINEKNALIVDYKNEIAIYEAMKNILTDRILREKIIREGKESIQIFSFEAKFEKLKKLYLS